MRSPVKADGPRGDAAGGIWRSGRFALAVAALTAAALALRLAFLDSNPLWYDEAYTWYAVRQPGVLALLHHLTVVDCHPPLYYLGLKAAVAALGRHGWVLRLPSLLAGVAAVPLAAALGRRAAPRGARLFVAASVAFLPALVHFSIEARAYAVLLALSLALAVVYRTWLERPRVTSGLALVALSVLAFYVRLFGAFVVAGLVLDLLVLRRRPARTGRALTGTLVVVGLAAPWGVAIFNQMRRWRYIAGIGRYLHLDIVLARYSPLRALPGRPAHVVGMVLFAALVIAAGVAAARAGRRPEAPLAGDPGAEAPRSRALVAAAAGLGGALVVAGIAAVLRGGAYHAALPVLAPFFLGRAALVAGAAVLGVALLPALVDGAFARLGDRGRDRWRRLARVDPDLAAPLLTVLAASAVAAVRPAIGYKPLIVVIPALLLFCGWSLLRAWPRAGGVALSGFVVLALVNGPLQGHYHRRADYRAAVPVLEARRRPGQPVLLYPGHHARQLDFYGPVAGVVPLWGSAPVRHAEAVRLRPGEVFWLLAATDDGASPAAARRVLAALERRARVTFHRAFFHVTLYRLVATGGRPGGGP